MKEKISQVIKVNIHGFIMKRNSHNGTELKNLNDTIDKYTTNAMNIYIEFGIYLYRFKIKLK